MNNEFLDGRLVLRIEDWKYAIMLALNEFLLNARLKENKLDIFKGDLNFDNIGTITIPLDLLSYPQKVYNFIKSYILSNLYLSRILPVSCNIGYELYKSFINFKDNIFLTHREHIVWQESCNIQGFLLNIDSIYLLEYSMVSPSVTLSKIEEEKISIVGEYSTFEDPNVLVRKMIFSIYENGFENVEDCPSIAL